MKRGVLGAMALLIVSSAVLAKGVITLDGQISPEFKGKSYSSYAVGAVSTVPRFRDYLEQKHAVYINKETGNEETAREMRLLFPREESANKQFGLDEIKQVLSAAKVQVFIFINIEDTGGASLKGIDTLDKALLASANFKQPDTLAKYYGASDVIAYELSTGKIVWKGQGVVKAKPTTPKWFRKSSILHGKQLAQHLVDAGLLKSDGQNSARRDDSQEKDEPEDTKDKKSEI